MVEGGIYKIRVPSYRDGNHQRIGTAHVKLKLIKLYPHHALFEDERGLRECFINFDLKKIENGEIMILDRA